MKQKSFEYNKEFPSNEVVIADIRQMSHGTIVLDADTLDNTRIDTSSVPGRSQNGRGKNNRNNNPGGNTNGFQQKKYTKRTPSK